MSQLDYALGVLFLLPCKSATVSMLLYIDVLTVYFVAPLSLFIKGLRGADLGPSHEPLTRRGYLAKSKRV